MGLFKKLMSKVKREKTIDPEIEKLLALDESDEDKEDIEDFEDEDFEKDFGEFRGRPDGFEKEMGTVSKLDDENQEKKLEQKLDGKTDQMDLLKSSFENDLLDELKKEDLSNLEEENSILNLLEEDVSIEELVSDLREVIQELEQVKK